VITDGWSNFLVAVAGAAGALAGLVFVSLSINLARILALPGVTGRAAETLILLGGVLLGSLLALIPGLSGLALGVSLFVVTGLAWGLPTYLQSKTLWHRQPARPRYLAVRIGAQQLATVPGLLASVLFMVGTGAPLRWFAFGVLMSFAVGLVNAWVLLVEIVR
jgi:hypothetical protein